MDKFRLSWSDHHAMLQTVFARLLVAEQFVDITLSCSGRNIRCHRVVLSACSSYFEGLLTSNQCPHPIIVMRDVTFEEMSDLVNFMYFGEVTVEEEKLPSLLKTAEFLEIKGLGSNSTSDISTDIDKKVSSSEKLADNRKRPGSSLSKSSEKRSTKQKVEPEEVDSFNGTNEYSDVATLPSAFAIKKSRKQTHVTQPLDNSTADDSFGADWNPDDLNESTKNNVGKDSDLEDPLECAASFELPITYDEFKTFEMESVSVTKHRSSLNAFLQDRISRHKGYEVVTAVIKRTTIGKGAKHVFRTVANCRCGCVSFDIMLRKAPEPGFPTNAFVKVTGSVTERHYEKLDNRKKDFVMDILMD